MIKMYKIRDETALNPRFIIQHLIYSHVVSSFYFRLFKMIKIQGSPGTRNNYVELNRMSYVLVSLRY